MAPKTKNTKQTETPVVEKTVTPVDATPATPATPATSVQEAGAKKPPAKKAAPAKVADVTAAAATGKKAAATGKKAAPAKKAAATPAEETKALAATPVEETKALAATGKKAAAAPKKEKVANPVADEEEAEDVDSKTRSFKVRLPGDEGFTGRFTGLTPYQAANKALSKYFRGLENNVESDAQVNFSIRESTRGSKRHEYTYKGSRIKLEQPITYTIKSENGEARVITKQYKNQLIKVKKSAAKQENVTV